MGPDRHLVCWEISLGRSERLPSPLPDSAHQMWGEGHIARSLCSAACSCSLSLSALPHAGGCTHCRAAVNQLRCCTTAHLCSSPPSPLLFSTILHRSEATSSFCCSVRLRLGSCSWQALLSDRLNSRYGTKACWSSSQYSRLHGTCREGHTKQLTHTRLGSLCLPMNVAALLLSSCK